MAYENLVRWYLTKGYDFDNIADEVKSDDIIKKEIKTLKDFADEISDRSKKPFSKGQKEGLRKALESDTIQGEFERNLSKRELQEQVRAEEYTAEVKRIKGLQQIAAAEEFETEYPDIKETLEIQNASKVRGIVKQEIVSRMAQAREKEYLERFQNTESRIRSETRETLAGTRSPHSLIKFWVPSPVLRERGEEYDRYIEIAKEVLVREGITDSTGRYIPLTKRKEV